MFSRTAQMVFATTFVKCGELLMYGSGAVMSVRCDLVGLSCQFNRFACRLTGSLNGLACRTHLFNA